MAGDLRQRGEMNVANAPATPPLRLVTVEDDPRYRQSLTLLIRSLGGFHLAASYSSAVPLLEAARKARSLDPAAPWDVVLTDIGLPGVDGVAATRELKSLFPALRVVALTAFEEPATVLAAICAGADGYLLKSASNDELLNQLDLILHHSAPLSAALAGTLMRIVRESQSAPFGTRLLPRDLGLTARQLHVLRGLVEGLSYREIGERLEISLDTVRSHIRQIYSALQVHSVAEAVGYALRHGLA
ncbi:response regulator transcription factor [Dyella tabacisoli]|nr:response regulator transcription factor [Dyella tabacisoli]